MKLLQPLETLDSLVLAQFEKVTQAANKHLGWDKYDLVEKVYNLAGISYAAYGVYEAMLYINNHQLMDLIVAPLNFAFGYIISTNAKKRCETSRKHDLNLMTKTGAIPFPKTNPFRPIALGFGLELFICGVFILKYGHPPPKEMKISNPETYSLLSGITTTLAGSSISLIISASYFHDTTMFPPSKKKVSLRSTYDAVKNKLSPKPQLEPAIVPSKTYSGGHK